MFMRFIAPAIAAFVALHAFAQEQPARPLSAKSAVLIVEPLSGSAAAANDAALERLARLHAVSLASEQNLRKAVVSGKHDVRKTKWFGQTSDITERAGWLRKNLRAQRVEGTPLIELSLDGITDSPDRAKVLEAVCETHLDTLRSERSAAMQERTALLNNVRIKVEMRLKDLTVEMREKQIKLNLDGGSGGITGGRLGYKEMELSALVARFIEAQLEANRLHHQFENLQAMVKAGQNPPNFDVDAEPRMQELLKKLDETEIQLALGKATLDKASPELAMAEAQAEAVRKVVQSRRDALASQAKVRLLEDLRERATAAGNNAESMMKRIENLKADLGELSATMVTYYNLQEEQRAHREQLKSIKTQIEETMMQAALQAVDIRWHLHPEAIDLP